MDSLVLRAMGGENDAFDELVLDLEKPLYRISKAILFNDNDCADAIQDAILLAYQSINKLQKPQYFQTWIIRILIRTCQKKLKEKKRQKKLFAQELAHPNDNPMEQVEFQLLLESMEDNLRVLVILYYDQQYKINEIAEMLDIPEGTVKSRLYRARQQLADYLGKSVSKGRDQNGSSG